LLLLCHLSLLERKPEMTFLVHVECFSAIADMGDVRKALKLECTIEDISIEYTNEIDAHNHERRIVCVEIAKEFALIGSVDDPVFGACR